MVSEREHTYVGITDEQEDTGLRGWLKPRADVGVWRHLESGEGYFAGDFTVYMYCVWVVSVNERKNCASQFKR